MLSIRISSVTYGNSILSLKTQTHVKCMWIHSRYPWADLYFILWRSSGYCSMWQWHSDKAFKSRSGDEADCQNNKHTGILNSVEMQPMFREKAVVIIWPSTLLQILIKWCKKYQGGYLTYEIGTPLVDKLLHTINLKNWQVYGKYTLKK